MLCVDCNIPILGATKYGNVSDKALNNGLLTNISKYMARHGQSRGAHMYVADLAFVAPDNLEKADKTDKTGSWFLTHLPAT